MHCTGRRALIATIAAAAGTLLGVLVPPLCPDSKLLDTANLHPLFQRAQELDLPILVHGGVFELFTKLRVAVFETSAGRIKRFSMSRPSWSNRSNAA